MHNECFQNANKVFVGVLKTNKRNGLDVRKPKKAITKADLEKLYEHYLIPGAASGDTEILQFKVFVDLVYLMGRHAKEGLWQLQKNWFKICKDDEENEFVEIIVNETTKKNQGNNLSASATLVHDDNNLMFAQPNTDRCPVKSFKKYMSLLNPKINDFFQHPSYNKSKYDAMAVGKNKIGKWMPIISERAGLSQKYSNHKIRKTCATSMKRGGIAIPNIAHHLKHKDIQTLQHYLEKPTIEDKQWNAVALHNYTVLNVEEKLPPIPEEPPQFQVAIAPQNPQQLPPLPVQAALPAPIIPEKENVQPENALVPSMMNQTKESSLHLQPCKIKSSQTSWNKPQSSSVEPHFTTAP